MADRKVLHSVVYMLEPGRFRIPRTKGERTHMASDDLKELLYPAGVTGRIFVTHTRPEPLIGTLHPLHTGYGNTVGLGFIGRGGTLTVEGMLFVNRCSWAHILTEAADILKMPREELLSKEELASLEGRLSPHGVIIS
jgi:phosphoketolase